MPDFRGVLCDGTVGGELGTAGNVQQALAAKVQPVCIIGIGFQLGVDIGCVVQQDEVVVGLVPGSAVQQGVIQLTLVVIGGNGAVYRVSMARCR